MPSSMLEAAGTYPKTTKLGSGEELVLRPTNEGDEEPLLEFFRAVPEEDRRFLKHDVTDPKVIARWLEQPDLERVFPLLAIHEGVVIGDATLHRSVHGWSQHVAEVRVVVAKAWRRKGVGEMLIRELVSQASDTGISILEALILEGQHGAQRAFEAIGFKVETVLRNRATDRSGRQLNVLVMTNDVAELWRRMEDLVVSSGPKSGLY